ncbi:MAG: D-arabinono-1,4-lactone oxidase [Aureliella sp.]
MEIRNFGRNVTFRPGAYFEPESEAEVLRILEENCERKFRTIGRLHAWSEAARSDEVALNLKHLNHIEVVEEDGQAWVRVGAGCQIKDVITHLDKRGLALPSQGLITEQTVAGAVSTGTHGSGKQCLSHFVEEVTVAVFDQDTGKPVVKTISDGLELTVAQCSLGCVGVILSLKLSCIPQYNIEEHFRFLKGLDDVFEAEEEFPLQQFFFLPHSWAYMAQHRRVTDKPKSRLASIYQVYWYVTVDVGLHAVLLFLTRVLKKSGPVRFFYKRMVPLTIVRNWRVVDKSQLILTMEHELFRHVEIEVFVVRSKLGKLLSFVRSIIEYSDGNREAFDSEMWSQLSQLGLSDSLESLRGSYTHHYPICIRKVLPDECPISMANGSTEPYYAVSFITYQVTKDRRPFFEFAKCLARVASEYFGARPHWGKVCPIEAQAVAKLYPRLAEFRKVCETLDSKGAFRNRWVEETLFGADG